MPSSSNSPVLALDPLLGNCLFMRGYALMIFQALLSYVRARASDHGLMRLTLEKTYSAAVLTHGSHGCLC